MAERGALTCPLCTGAMREQSRSGLVVDVCDGCGAIFFDAGEFDAAAPLSEGTELRMLRWARPRGQCAECGEAVDEADETHCQVPLHLFCPRCGVEVHHVRTRTIRLEYCDGCGGFVLEPEMVRRLASRVSQPDPPPVPAQAPEPPGFLEKVATYFGVAW